MRRSFSAFPRLRRVFQATLLLLLVTLIGYLDWITPREYSMALLYFVPLALFALRASLPAVLAMSIYAAMTWFLAGYFAPSSPMRAYPFGALLWIGSIRVGTLAIFSYLVQRTTKATRARAESQERLRRLNEELEQRVAERTTALRKSLDEMEHFSYALVHDLRSPLRAMIGFAELVEQDCARGRAPNQAFLRNIKAASSRMDRLVTDALSFSNAVREVLPLHPVDLNVLLRDLVESYPNLQHHQAEIEIQERLPAVLGNEAGLTQCFGNLLSNAVKFTKPGTPPHIRVWATPGQGLHEQLAARGESGQPGQPTLNPRQVRSVTTSLPKPGASTRGLIRIWVGDNGVGIPRSMQGNLFNLFQRGTNAQQGTGIGLAIVRKVVERMGGTVGVESQEGSGSRFWVELPSASPNGPEQKSP